jgi:hypothetical protein
MGQHREVSEIWKDWEFDTLIMFTGIIIELGEVIALNKKGSSARLSIKGKETINDSKHLFSVREFRLHIGYIPSLNARCLIPLWLQENSCLLDSVSIWRHLQ